MTAPDLPLEVEHHMPDYHLYDEYVGRQIARGIKPQTYSDYMDYSIGFTTRGCFRKCPFCVNQKYDHVFRHSPVKEFFAPSRKHIYLWDDQFFGFPKWQEVLDELDETGRRFQFRQGLDVRLMTEEKKALLIENTARNIAPVTDNVKYRHAVHCYLADEDYGRRITEAMGLDFGKVKELSALSHSELVKATLNP